jgi:transcriptional regulator with XRE-family HTH domain
VARPSHLGALGAAIRGYRAEHGISQEELGYRAGLHRTYISNIERGEQSLSYINVVKLAKALAIPTSELISRAEQIQRRRQPSDHPRRKTN